ncbi:putative transmembrane protein [Flavobacterium anhuiense]|uniref:Putative transmembrane protein n=1 Tax=Flavobacterium anhuiense TaxID=459526 RepID=A0A444VWC0_9FLAO|nr:hypothetical protein [Flavobacterium anhuiense]RYJ37853.1 putative transmembrane protein [Flavobacterium anhuiense]
MKTKWFTNPFYLYIFSFVLIFFIYNLKWSNAYPDLTISVGLFLTFTFLISFFLGRMIRNTNIFVLKKINSDAKNKFVLLLVTISYAIEFIDNRGIPFVLLFTHGGSYGDFEGIPVFHVFLASFTIYYTIYIFHQFLCNRNKRLLFYFLYFLLFQLWVVSRGTIFFILLACLFLYLFNIKIIKLRALLYLLLFILSVFYLFGVLGNLRSVSSRENEEMILDITSADDTFKSSNIPKEFYWSYLYLASPLGNLQSVVNSAHSQKEVDVTSFNRFMVNCIFPDFLGKRLAKLQTNETENLSDYFVFEIINAPTVYSLPFMYLGWLGPILMFFFMTFNVFLFMIIKNSSYFHSGFAILLSMIFFQVFNNFWIYSGISIDLIYPFILSVLHNLLIKKQL